jgi:folate-binding protein YgfZ
MTRLTLLPQRSVVAVAGDDRAAFLQGLISNDIDLVRPGRAIWAALLTPQGKWLADFFVHAGNDALLLDCEAAQAGDLVKRLSRFRLRSKVTVRAEPELQVYVAWDGTPDGVGPDGAAPGEAGPGEAGPDGARSCGAKPDVSGIVAPDPRLPDFAWRILSAGALAVNATPDDWDRRRLAAGLPDGSHDLEAGNTVLLEAGFDELNGVSWSKGCYMGQELTARTKYRGLLKRRLVPVAIQGPLPSPGTPVLHGATEAGTMRSGNQKIGLATVRLDALDGELRCGDAVLSPLIPAWMRLSGGG